MAAANLPATQETVEGPKDATPTVAKTAETADAVLPTYESSQKSDYFVTGKALMQAGDFEQSMATVEQGLEQTRERLAELGVENIDLHEAIAPFHYLYGTTLLYSIEESTDPQQQMTNGVREDVAAASSEGVAAVAAAASPDQPEDDDPATVAADGAEGAVAPTTLADMADDMQIAWENLEAARAIVDKMLAEINVVNDGTRRTTLLTDMAQILLREGDLQRFNGRYDDAVTDYQSSLDVRMKLSEINGGSDDEKYSRKMADVHYNLGLSHLSYASEIRKEPDTSAPEQQQHSDNSMDEATRRRLSEDHRAKGIQHYVECAKVLSARIALLCRTDPSHVLAAGEASSSSSSNIDITANDDQSKRSVQPAGLKTTGLDGDDDTAPQETSSGAEPSQTSLQLAGLRRAVADMQAPTPDDAATVADLKEFLDELQETIDLAAQAEQAVQEASRIRAQAQRAAAERDAVDTTDGVTTQIGFDAVSFETAAAASSASPTMMVVKKKKKKRPSVEADGESKQAPAEESALKKVRTE